LFTGSPDGTQVIETSASTDPVSYETTNQQHTALEAINATTLSVTRRYYDPWGQPVGAAPASWPDNHAYLGKPADPTTGLDLLGARQYNPATGSFTSLDPLLEAGDPQQMGGYTYAADNPATLADPTGLMFCSGASYCGGGTGENHGHPTVSPGPCPGCNGGGGGSGGGGGGSGCASYIDLCNPNPGTGSDSGSHTRWPPPNPCLLTMLCWNTQLNSDYPDRPGNHLNWDTTLEPCPAGPLVLICPNLASSGEPGQKGGASSSDNPLADLLRLFWQGSEEAAQELDQLSNVKRGEVGVLQTIDDLKAANGEVLGEQISLRGAGWQARADLYAQLPSGERVFIEVKTGPGAVLSQNQTEVYAATRSGGAVPYGPNAAKAGLPPGVPLPPTPVWIVWQPWPLLLGP
jgi:RHS repeat-associated protein